MKKMLMVLMLAMLVVIFSGSLAQARPPGVWVEFATIRGQNVGEPDIIKIYYDADTLRIDDIVQKGLRFRSVYCHIWQEGRLWWDFVRLENNPFVGNRWVYYSEANRFPLRTGGTSIQPMPIPKGSVLEQLLLTFHTPDGGVRKEINEISEKNKRREEEKRKFVPIPSEEETRQARLKEEEDMKQAEESIKEAIREGKKRRIDWRYVKIYSYDPRSNMTKEEYGRWQRIRGNSVLNKDEMDCAKKKFFKLYQDLEDSRGGSMDRLRLK